MAQSPISLAICRGCGDEYGVTTTVPIQCWMCGTPVSVACFGKLEWDEEQDPAYIAACVWSPQLNLNQSPRKRRLIFVTVLRASPTQFHCNHLHQAIESGETWAETGDAPDGVNDLRISLQQQQYQSNPLDPRAELFRVAAYCVTPIPSLDFSSTGDFARRLFADAYRDAFPNPFVPLEWQPEWFTSTVRDLAAHIYAERDFSTMPMLGDALMDAGCDHQLIQQHCHSTKPHARGCWVVDAILGKS